MNPRHHIVYVPVKLRNKVSKAEEELAKQGVGVKFDVPVKFMDSSVGPGYDIYKAFPWDAAPGYMIRDRDRIYGAVVTRRLRAMGIRDKPIAPWLCRTADRIDPA